MLLNLTAVDTVRELNSTYHLGLDLDKPESPEVIRKAIRQQQLRRKQEEIFRQWEKGSLWCGGLTLRPVSPPSAAGMP